MRNHRVPDSDSSRPVRAGAVRGTGKSASAKPQRPAQILRESSKPFSSSIARSDVLKGSCRNEANPPGLGLTISAGQRSSVRPQQVASATSSSRDDGSSIPLNKLAIDNEKIFICIGIETEFLLQPKGKQNTPYSPQNFLESWASAHNQVLGSKYTVMLAPEPFSIYEYLPLSVYSRRWIVVEEAALFQWTDGQGKYAVEMKTPKIDLNRTPKWKDNIRATWAFLEKRCLIEQNRRCSTHVHISIVKQGIFGIESMGLANMKRISQCAIHFEPALEALVSEFRRGNEYAGSNWIDNENFANKESTRESAISQIGACTTESQVVHLMCPYPRGRDFAWNFRALFKLGTIEYRKGSASVNAEQAIAWAELVVLFVQAALRHRQRHPTDKELTSLRTTPANVGALKEFLSDCGAGNNAADITGINVLLRGTTDADSVQPTRIFGRLGRQIDMLEAKLVDDAARQKRLADEASRRRGQQG